VCAVGLTWTGFLALASRPMPSPAGCRL
jgi:hypothetical protein